ncbi:MAG: adenylosuccinate lyase [Anaerolineales bacterium]|nr:adenylosuccinate lyase [Anaerolineales bacterium]
MDVDVLLDDYASPFSSRYGSVAMRRIFSEKNRRTLWRRIWIALAETQQKFGLVRPEQVEDLRLHAADVTLERSLEIEKEIGHDVMAEVRAFAELCPVGGGIIHWGATSADITDNADVLRMRDGMDLLLDGLRRLLEAVAGQIERYAGFVVLGYTHLQPAEPTTLGYRLALFGQDLLEHWEDLGRIRDGLRGKGMKGAVGTAASYGEILNGKNVSPDVIDATVMEMLGLKSYPIASQTYPRIQDYRALSALAGLAAALHKFAFDLRIMQSAGFGEVREPMGKRQVGSSAMPFKRNPVKSENVCSLARFVAVLPEIAWQNAASNLLERTLDDSANRRSILPEAFLATEEMLTVMTAVVGGLDVDEAGCAANLARFGAFSASERVLMGLVAAGADRQAMHEKIREHSRKAWEVLREGRPNPLADYLAADPDMLKHLQPARIRELMDAGAYVGSAPDRAREMAKRIKAAIKE